MLSVGASLPAFPRSLSDYAQADTLAGTLAARLHAEPFNAVAAAVFGLAIIHIFAAPRFITLAHAAQHKHDDARARARRPPTPSAAAELLHVLGEVEVVFGLWAVVLMGAITAARGWETATHYLNDTVSYTEALFVVVIMALASTRPIIAFAEGALRRVARVGGGTPAAWWVSILTIGPVLGSVITEPAAMTICAILLARQFFDLKPGAGLKYATLGLLFVNVSIGGTFTNFAAPPVLMVARSWDWNTSFMLAHFGWRAALGICASTLCYFVIFRRELMQLAALPPSADADVGEPDEPGGTGMLLPVPWWLTAVHVAFMGWTVFNAHDPALFIGGFLIFVGFARATAPYQSRVDLKAPLLVGFFLAGLVIHGGLQGWWIAPVLGSLSRVPLLLSSVALTAFNDNALITYLATLVPDLDPQLKMAIVQGAVAGGGLTVIANAPNPAGQALLAPFFDGAIRPVHLLAGALLPTIISVLMFQV